jgi:CheY-like chemotaxis protein
MTEKPATSIEQPVFLYVEDDMMSRQIMLMMLKRGLGYEHVTIFEDSTDFLSKLKALDPPPNIIFLDIHMEPDDGFTMLKQLRAEEAFKETKVFALTASVMNEEVNMLKTSGFNGAIAKPIQQSVFPQLMKRIMAGENVWHIK